MRLTLRTLLAYLDDTIDASEIKDIGQKVSESEAAQELIARIKDVTRRRRYTTPEIKGPDDIFEANTVAEYLDNELDAETIAEIEKICLESDVHLAEIAACHQILTLLISGEPMLIPPASKQRMYDVIHGRKKARAARARPAATSETVSASKSSSDYDEEDDTLLLGLPLFRQAPWLRWALPLAAAVLLIVLGGVVWKVVSDSTEQVASNGAGTGPTVPPSTVNKDGINKDPIASTDNPKTDDTPPVSKDNTPPTDKVTPPTDDKPPFKDLYPTDKTIPPKDTTIPAKDTTVVKDKEPSKDGEVKPGVSKDIEGTFMSMGEILVQRNKETNDWERVAPEAKVSSGVSVVSLPGFHSEIKFNTGVNLLLWGNVPEGLAWPLLESAVVLHDKSEFDLDLTINRGRIYLSNEKNIGAVTARVRFHDSTTGKDQFWIVTLDSPGTEVGIEIVHFPLNQEQYRKETPYTGITLYFANGTGEVQSGYRTFGNLQRHSTIVWNNKDKGLSGPNLQPEAAAVWNKNAGDPRQLNALSTARQELSNLLAKGNLKVEVGLLESLEDENALVRKLGIRALGAIDAVSKLIDALTEADKIDKLHVETRRGALFTLRNWLARGKDQWRTLYDPQESSGILLDKRYTTGQAGIIVDLLFPFSQLQMKSPETYSVLIEYLRNNRLAIRELAIWHLLYLVPEGGKIGYNPAGGEDQRAAAYLKWKQLIPDGKMPPLPSGPSGG